MHKLFGSSKKSQSDFCKRTPDEQKEIVRQVDDIIKKSPLNQDIMTKLSQVASDLAAGNPAKSTIITSITRRANLRPNPPVVATLGSNLNVQQTITPSKGSRQLETLNEKMPQLRTKLGTFFSSVQSATSDKAALIKSGEDLINEYRVLHSSVELYEQTSTHSTQQQMNNVQDEFTKIKKIIESIKKELNKLYKSQSINITETAETHPNSFNNPAKTTGPTPQSAEELAAAASGQAPMNDIMGGRRKRTARRKSRKSKRSAKRKTTRKATRSTKRKANRKSRKN